MNEKLTQAQYDNVLAQNKQLQKHANDLGDLLAKREQQLDEVNLMIKSVILNITDVTFAKRRLLEAVEVINE